MRSRLGRVFLLGTVASCFLSMQSLTAQQQTSETDSSNTGRCARWLRATVPTAIDSDPVLLCSNKHEEGSPDGWWSTYRCGRDAKAPAQAYCASMVATGTTGTDGFMAIGFASSTPDGHGLLKPDGPARNGLAGAIFFSWFPIRLGDLELPSGMFKLIPFRSTDGWRLAVARLDGEWNDDKSSEPLGTIKAETLPVESSSRTLHFDLRFHPDRACGAPGDGVHVHELHMAFGDIDLFACVRPGLGSGAQQSRTYLPAIN